MKKSLIMTMLALMPFMNPVNAQTWNEPIVPHADLTTLTSDEIVYFYNVEADVFFVNGMDWNTNACATRLTNGNKDASGPQQCYVYVDDGNVRIKHKNSSSYFLSCLSNKANDIYVDQNQGYTFSFKETEEGSHFYTLTNNTYGGDLDLSWNNGGHLTIVGGVGLTTWAFIPESEIVGGGYALFKAKQQLYQLFKAIESAGKLNEYAEELDAAYEAYTSSNATYKTIEDAATLLFNSTFADITTPVDVSFLFKNADMAGKASVEGWTSITKDISWAEFELYHSAAKFSQTQIVPQGMYDVKLHAIWRNDGNDAAPVLAVTASNSVTADIPTIYDFTYNVGNTNNNGWTTTNGKIVPSGMQSASSALTQEGAVAVAKGAIVDASGNLTITFDIKSTSQWFNWQGLEIVYTGLGDANLKDGLKQIVAMAENLYGNGTGVMANELKAAIDTANDVMADGNASNKAIMGIEAQLKQLMADYKLANASVDDPIDYTSHIKNPSFEKGYDNWTVDGFGGQTNTSFTIKSDNTYMEKWTSKGNKVGDALLDQAISDLPLGVYILKAAAQNIQEGSSKTQTGAWLFANTSKKDVNSTADYSLTFVNIEQETHIGFKAVGATGNWIACDNFRLYYAGGTLADFQNEMQKYIDDAQALTSQKMQQSASDALTAAISSATAELAKGSNTSGYPKAATTLRKATEQARTSIEAFANLQVAIDKALANYGEGTLAGADEFLAAINQAKDVNSNHNSTFEQMDREIENLEKAAFAYLLNNPSGAVPTVVTDTRFARGNTMAFGRMSYSGVSASNIKEAGFCWSTDKNPTVLDNRTTEYINHSGKIIKMTDLKPATVYYARAYVLTTKYAVGYGEPIKIVTLPKADITWSYNNAGDAATNDRIINACKTAFDYYWSNLTSIQNYHITVNYNAGVPTAECSYGGWMSVGASSSYQAPGTLMHEANHGIGVGQTDIWYGDSPLRENRNSGRWMGDRATDLLSFWDNTLTYLQGDGQHMWPYGINGAHEDNHSDDLYCINGLLNQAICEDGLIPVGRWNGGFCLPAYVFNHEEGVKYYIKNENEKFGLYSSYLTEDASGRLKWVEMSAEEAAANDNAAWYITFTPSNQYYQFRNAATGKYITYSSGFKTASKTTPANSESFHLMRARIDTTIGFGNDAVAFRGYWIINAAAGGSNPPTMTAAANGNVNASNFSLENTATNQRWLILTQQEINKFESVGTGAYLDQLNQMLTNIRTLAETPHVETTEGSDETVAAALADIETRRDGTKDASVLYDLIEETKAAGITFLSGVTPASMDAPFDVTFLMNNPAIDNNEGWSEVPTFNFSCAEFYESTFEFIQTLPGMAKGTYKLKAQAFQRPGSYSDVYNDFSGGTDNVNALLLCGLKNNKIKNIMADASDSKLGGSEATVGGKYVPNNMEAASKYFAKGLYENEVVGAVLIKKGNLKVGIKSTKTASSYWTIFDNFRLYYYGSYTVDEVAAINDIMADDIVTPTRFSNKVYNLQGIQVGTSIDGLPAGLYIQNGNKVMVK